MNWVEDCDKNPVNRSKAESLCNDYMYEYNLHVDTAWAFGGDLHIIKKVNTVITSAPAVNTGKYLPAL